MVLLEAFISPDDQEEVLGLVNRPDGDDQPPAGSELVEQGGRHLYAAAAGGDNRVEGSRFGPAQVPVPAARKRMFAIAQFLAAISAAFRAVRAGWRSMV